MKRKWKDDRGETLVEVMVSILIGALSAALLFSAVMASYNINQKAKAADNSFSDSLNAAEARTAEISTDKVKVKNKDDSTITEAEVPVKFYGGREAWSYSRSFDISSP